MRVLVVIFGGLDHEFLGRLDCSHLRQAQWGRVQVDGLYRERDVATQITAQLITGRTWRENGVLERKREIVEFRHPFARWLEEGPLRKVDFARHRRRALYELLGWRFSVRRREYLKDDLQCPSLFERVEHSKAVYVPAYNPEPSWALDRNILDPRHYPELGVQGALDLREKNYLWRRKKFMEALEEPPYQLLVGQFQYIDSTQHLYLSYQDPPDMAEVEKAYWRMDEFAAEILDKAKGRYDRVLFISDNGAARKKDYRPTHYNRPYYSLSEPEELASTNLRDFFGYILDWVSREPHPGKLKWDERATAS